MFLHRRELVSEPVSTSCQAKTNSLGCTPVIGASGAPTLSGPDAFFLTATQVRSRQPGLLVLSLAPAQTPFAGGFLCLAPALIRTPFQNSGGNTGAPDCSGTYSLHLSQSLLASLGAGAGTSMWAQWVSRDPGFAAPDALGLSAAVGFSTIP